MGTGKAGVITAWVMHGLSREGSDRTKWIVLTFTIIFWGLAFTAIKHAVQVLSPFELAFLRFLVADFLFILTVFFKGYRIRRKDIPTVFVLGFFGVTVYHVCLNAGEMYIPSGIASLIISTAPVFVLVLSAVFLKEGITYRKVAGIAIALVGVYVLSRPDSAGHLIGVLLVLISTISAAIYTVLGKSTLKRYSSGVLTSYVMLFGSVPLSIYAPSSFEKLLELDAITILSVVFLGVFSTYLAYQGWYYVLKREEASRASVFLNAIPVVSIVAGSLLLSEPITLSTLAGGAMILAGILIVLRAKS
ncbi:EamA family transporter [Geoglobus acetivorans]|uniref:DMT family transporter n=1 Tax=Geoglobus acetivorans TaxID=565033 RepID=A0ABZ3H2E0_GEOAI|nr:EamA family transporter [Geoglobus acetivorans]